MPKIEPSFRALAAANDIATGLQLIERAIVYLDFNPDDLAAFERFANKIARTTKRRIPVVVLKEHVQVKSSREDMHLDDWIEYQAV